MTSPTRLANANSAPAMTTYSEPVSWPTTPVTIARTSNVGCQADGGFGSGEVSTDGDW